MNSEQDNRCRGIGNRNKLIFNAATRSGRALAVSSPSGSGRSPASKRQIGAFFGLTIVYLARPSMAIINATYKKLPTDCAKSFSFQTDSSARNQFLAFSITFWQWKQIFPITDINQSIYIRQPKPSSYSLYIYVTKSWDSLFNGAEASPSYNLPNTANSCSKFLATNYKLTESKKASDKRLLKRMLGEVLPGVGLS